MSYMIEFTEDKFDELTENVEKMLRYGSKVMSCVQNMRTSREPERREYRERDYEEHHRY